MLTLSHGRRDALSGFIYSDILLIVWLSQRERQVYRVSVMIAYADVFLFFSPPFVLVPLPRLHLQVNV